MTFYDSQRRSRHNYMVHTLPPIVMHNFLKQKKVKQMIQEENKEMQKRAITQLNMKKNIAAKHEGRRR